MDNILDIQRNEISSNIKGKIFWFHGEPGTWKTTVASHFPKPFFAGFEIGYQFIDGIYAAPMTTWSDMKDLYRQLRNPKVKEKFETIVFDTISNASTLCYKYALNQLDVSDPSYTIALLTKDISSAMSYSFSITAIFKLYFDNS